MALTAAQIASLNRADPNDLTQVLAAIGFGTMAQQLLLSGKVKVLGVVGKNGAGACTATGAAVGDKVVGIVDVAVATVNAASLYEATVTVADQVQQSSATDRSAIKHIALLVTPA